MAPAATSIAGQKNADRRSQSQSDSESDPESAERALFDSTLRVVRQVFRRAATLFDGAPCSAKSIFDRIGDGFLHAFDFGAQLVTEFYGFFQDFGLHCYFLLDP
jgi:hypothetical protein